MPTSSVAKDKTPESKVEMELSKILNGIKNEKEIISALMIEKGPLWTIDQDNDADINLESEFDIFNGRHGSITEAIIGLANINNNDINATINNNDLNAYLLKNLSLYHWGNYLGVPIQWTDKIEQIVYEEWIKEATKDGFTETNIVLFLSKLDDTLTPSCPLPIKFFAKNDKETELYWFCVTKEEYNNVLKYNVGEGKKALQHIFVGAEISFPGLRARTCKFVYFGSINIPEDVIIGEERVRIMPDIVRGSVTIDIPTKQLGNDNVRYLPERIYGDLTFGLNRSGEYDIVIGDDETKTRYLPDIVGGNLEFTAFHENIGNSDKRYLPDTVGGNLDFGLNNHYGGSLGEGQTRYLPDTVGGYFKLGQLTEETLTRTGENSMLAAYKESVIGNGKTRYLPDTVGGTLFLPKFAGSIGNGKTRYLPDTVGGDLELAKFNQPIGNGKTRYLPDTVGGELSLNRFTQVVGDGDTMYLPDVVKKLLLNEKHSFIETRFTTYTSHPEYNLYTTVDVDAVGGNTKTKTNKLKRKTNKSKRKTN